MSGLPELPKEYRKYLLAKPIQATIISVAPNITRSGTAVDTPVIVEAGTQQGLLVGMELVVIVSANQNARLTVTRTWETRSEAVMTRQRADEPGPQVGWKLSTRDPKAERAWVVSSSSF